MNLTAYYQVCDDWGWFIDIEENNNTYTKNILYPYKATKKFNKLKTIDEYEDEYDYYEKNYKDLEENYDMNLTYLNKHDTNKHEMNKHEVNKNDMNKTTDIYIPTLITSLLAYVIFIIL